ncbi:formate/nitrite transporter family protein [Anaerotignum lactatifermentans]|uniref:Formate/nitrite transporter family protein n=1 Tax=Anaerotignum lactatifermentans TaxID=160404 RepID=A0ABS2GB26_9FIRM|nr:formate/nitrite transporter family protein [Anaerotignum lactatifermentans]MBM6828576.1 formate/nitrite transporter family protein [Anaerotignum lactatifermentans]MBM6877983.1 formate/nitrite transporter family protein [Anaerotignum lactatifermentans]MBM6950158.1 formate/nitrite transporter family protein [Anaerotignum lactatifermentans]
MERIRQFFSAILAGMMIGMGGTVYLSQGNPVVGSFLFAVGLFTVVVFQLHLYTGKIGYLAFQKPVYLLELLITWAGNFCGTYLVAFMVRNSRIYESMAEKVQNIAAVKLQDEFFSLFLLAVFCGMLMFIAVDVFRNQSGSTIRTIGVFVPVMVFILSGFEHVIANMFYFSLAGVWSGHCLAAVVVMTLGNSVGGLLIPVYLRIFRQREA